MKYGTLCEIPPETQCNVVGFKANKWLLIRINYRINDTETSSVVSHVSDYSGVFPRF